MIAPSSVVVPIMCPAPGCFTTVDCTVEVSFQALGPAGAIRTETPMEVTLAEVAVHVMAEHPELCEPAPIEP